MKATEKPFPTQMKDGRLRRGSYLIGDAVVTRVQEQYGPGLGTSYLFPEWDPSVAVQHPDLFAPEVLFSSENKFIASVHSWLIQTRKHIILIDTCSGNQKNRPTLPRAHGLESPFLERLFAAGVRPEDVDFVVCTHLHAGHCGWNTKLHGDHWLPTFPNARYVFSKAELDHWSGPAGRAGVNAGVYEDSVLPIIEAGQELVVDGTVTIADNHLLLHPTPGHSPGHIVVSLSSDKREAVFCGDVLHQPMQVYRPTWNSRFCEEPDAARACRQWLLQHAAERRAIVFTGHFPLTSVGRVNRHGEGFSWTYLSGNDCEKLFS
jgi:glyoxylase-like metal-dependent hydrolase (beta-lactamase superfamily II)